VGLFFIKLAVWSNDRIVGEGTHGAIMPTDLPEH
jgi:hypothetical protein